MKIITLTLSPAYDVHAYSDKFDVGRENLARILSRDAGGKGLNISRALTEYGVENTAVLLLGDEDSWDFEEAVKKANINSQILKTTGRIRENITIHTDCGETRISFTGVSASTETLSEIKKLTRLCRGDILTVTGRIPEGIPLSELKSYLVELKERGIRIVIDSRSFTLLDIADVKPWLIKPKYEDISEYMKKDIKDIDSAIDSAKEIFNMGIDLVLISLGKEGAVLFDGKKALCAGVPEINTVSTIGAGDSMIAGFIAGISEGKDTVEALRYASAFGVSACLTEGTCPPKKAQIQEMTKKIKIYERS